MSGEKSTIHMIKGMGHLSNPLAGPRPGKIAIATKLVIEYLGISTNTVDNLVHILERWVEMLFVIFKWLGTPLRADQSAKL